MYGSLLITNDEEVNNTGFSRGLGAVVLLGTVEVRVVQTVHVVDGGLDQLLQLRLLFPGRVLYPGRDPRSLCNMYNIQLTRSNALYTSGASIEEIQVLVCLFTTQRSLRSHTDGRGFEP